MGQPPTSFSLLMILPVPLRTSETIRASTESRLGKVAPTFLRTSSTAPSADCVCTGGAGNGTGLCSDRSAATPFQLSRQTSAIPAMVLPFRYNEAGRATFGSRMK